VASEPPVVAPTQIILVGDAKHPLRDAYHAVLIRSWWFVLGGIALAFLVVNALFALAYWFAGGVASAHSFADDFYFSVQTSGTIGYGAMYPIGRAAELLVVAEAVVSLIVTALVTGLVFAKFSRSPARVRFSRHATFGPHDGRTMLMVRLGNQRGGAIVDATIHVTMTRTEITAEGERFYRQRDLPLVRSRAPALSRSWTVMHAIDESSPLFGATAASLAACDAELGVSISGTDEITLQSSHARHTYDNADIAWDMRHADLIREEPGKFIVDLTRFDDVVPAALQSPPTGVGSRA
jgi:inward rectifier potassium channel